MRHCLGALRTAGVVAMLAWASTASALDTSEADYALKLLGQYVFFDKLSMPARMSCATCHAPDNGGTGSSAGTNLHEVVVTGANPHAAGNLKPPTNAYATLVKPFAPCNRGALRVNGTLYCGGNFWDGRAEGNATPYFAGTTKHLGSEVFQGVAPAIAAAYQAYLGPSADQALNPMPSPAEQNISRKAVCDSVSCASYAPLFVAAWGVPLDCGSAPAVSAADVPSEVASDITFKRLILAVAAYQSSRDLNSFSSKRDQALRAELACVAGDPLRDPAVCSAPDYLNSPGTFPLVGLSAQENLGHELFYNVSLPGLPPTPRSDLPGANCSLCHASDAQRGLSPGERYTDDSFHNIGAPMNPELPAAPYPGLEGHVGVPTESARGGFRVPTLRNVDKRRGAGFPKAYTHNGWFKSLESLVHFYNTSRVLPRCAGSVTEAYALAHGCWPEPEWPGATVPPGFVIGALGLSPAQEAALVTYLKTLTDAVTATAPTPYRAR